MRKVVIDAHSVHDTSQLEPTANALERLQRGDTSLERDARMSRSEERRERILRVVPAEQ